jgi:energy-coupling factor transporter ATP-binding protein EcfA2
MKVSKIQIRNILGIEELEIEPGKFTAIVGRNGSGKTSTLEAIKSALRGGHDATLLRNGTEQGEVVLLLDDGTEIAKRVTASTSSTAVTDADGKRSKKPAESIKQLIDALSVNPIEFLSVPRKQQIAALLESMPMVADLDRLNEITGMALDGSLMGLHAMEVIEAVLKQVYDERTGTNRAVREKEATINQLSATIPANLAGAAAGGEDYLLDGIEAADKQRAAEIARVNAKLAGMEAEWDGKLVKIEAEMQVLREQQAEVVAQRADIRGRAGRQRDKAEADYLAACAPIREQLAVIKSNRDAAARAAATRDTVKQMTEEAAQLAEDAARATAALDSLEAYKAELLADLPIPGLEVRDAEIWFRGVLFDRLNSAEQVKVAVEVAKLRAGALGLVCVDGIERLDDTAFEEFKSAAIESGLQLVVTRVADGDFAVEASNG